MDTKLTVLCGEDSPKQICPKCAPKSKKEEVVDYNMDIRLEQVVEYEPSTRLITLPCSHTFTIETLDGHAQMADYYVESEQGK